MTTRGFTFCRPGGVHHPVARALAGVLAVAMLVLGFLGSPPELKAQTVEWDTPLGLPALPASEDTGRAVPVPLDPQIDGSFPVSVSKSPTLVWRDVPAGVGQVKFSVTTPSGANLTELWSKTVAVGSDRVARARVTSGLLRQGSTYLWRAAAVGDAKAVSGPHSMTVDQQRASTQPVWSFAGASVAEGTGELIYTYAAPTLPFASGSVGWSLVHRPTNEPQQGFPDGWNLVLSGTSGWRSIEVNRDGSVTLTNTNGSTVTYTRNAADHWVPLVGRYNNAGETTLLTQNADGSFSATDDNSIITVFSAPTTTNPGYPIRQWSPDQASAQQSWVDGRLAKLTDPITQKTAEFFYGGSSACFDPPGRGFIPAPAGDLCAVVDWTGNVLAIFYVDTPTGPQIGRVVSSYVPVPTAPAQDIRWDASGRIVGLRAPFTTSVVASGAIPGLEPQDERLQTLIDYDEQGRVQRITAPDPITPATASAPSERASESFSYAPFSVKADRMTTPSGYLMRAWLDPTTLQTVKQADDAGNLTTFAYDSMGNRTRVTDVMTGTVTETRFDALGRPVAQLGPTRGSLDAPTAPRTSIAYDQNDKGQDWQGVAVRYWDNAGFNGAPVRGESSAALAGYNWATNPAGGSGAWSARLTGLYRAPADGAYRFENQTAAKLWIGGRLCAPVCTANLAQDGFAAIRVDVTSPNGSAAGVNVVVTRPGGTAGPVPLADLRPGYNLATSTITREQDPNGGTRNVTTRNTYDLNTLRLVSTTTPSGARSTKTYEPFVPQGGTWGRPTGYIDPDGRKTTFTYAPNGTTAEDCAGNANDQSGKMVRISLPGGEEITRTTTASGNVVKTTSSGTTLCAGSGLIEDPGINTQTVTGIGSSVAHASVGSINGNPMRVVVSALRKDGEPQTQQYVLDSNGAVRTSTDPAGTTTTLDTDPYTGRLERVVERTAKGETRVTRYTYAPTGGIATMTVDGTRLITNEYTSNGQLVRSVLANGAVQTFELDQNNNGRKATTTFPDGTVISETATHSPTGRLLSRTVNGPNGTARFSYSYNADGRLIDTKLEGSIPTSAVAWSNEYDREVSRNGNRTSKTWTLADGTKKTSDFAYGEDGRLLSASNTRIGEGVEYDAAGRTTRIGSTSLEYDAAGHLLKASDASRSYTFTGDGTTVFTKTTGDDQRTVSATLSGRSLILDGAGGIDGRIIHVATGVTALLDEDGDIARWIYDDMLGNGAWTSRGDAAPTRTHLYSPSGEPISVNRTSDPRTPTDIIVDTFGWQSGNGASTLRLATPVITIGARVYTPDANRWLQPDPHIGGSTNAYEYAIGDPINHIDPSGNASIGWLWGGVAAAVIGIGIGIFTAGIGGVAAQVAIGTVAGIVSGAGGEVITQIVDNSGTGTPINWGSVGIAAGIGAAAGALTTYVALAGTRSVGAARNVRTLSRAEPPPAEVAEAVRSSSVRTAAAQVEESGLSPAARDAAVRDIDFSDVFGPSIVEQRAPQVLVDDAIDAAGVARASVRTTSAPVEEVAESVASRSTIRPSTVEIGPEQVRFNKATTWLEENFEKADHHASEIYRRLNPNTKAMGYFEADVARRTQAEVAANLGPERVAIFNDAVTKMEAAYAAQDYVAVIDQYKIIVNEVSPYIGDEQLIMAGLGRSSDSWRFTWPW